MLEMDDATHNSITYRQYEHDAISDSSTDLPNRNMRVKRPWSDDSNDNIDEQDTFMSGDDSLSSSCSISEMRSLKRLRIQDNQPQHPSFQKHEVQRFRKKTPPVLRSVSISIDNNNTSIFAPTSQLPENTSPSCSPWNVPRVTGNHTYGCKKGEGSTPRILPVKEGVATFGSNLQNTTKMQESNEYMGFNRVLGNLHMNRRNQRLAVDPLVRQGDHLRYQDTSIRGHIGSDEHELNVRNNAILQQVQSAYHHQRQTKNAPNWKRQVRLQSNSQLYE